MQKNSAPHIHSFTHRQLPHTIFLLTLLLIKLPKSPKLNEVVKLKPSPKVSTS